MALRINQVSSFAFIDDWNNAIENRNSCLRKFDLFLKRTSLEYTPLHYSCALPSLYMIRLLIEKYSANALALDAWCRTPLERIDHGYLSSKKIMMKYERAYMISKFKTSCDIEAKQRRYETIQIKPLLFKSNDSLSEYHGISNNGVTSRTIPHFVWKGRDDWGKSFFNSDKLQHEPSRNKATINTRDKLLCCDMLEQVLLKECAAISREFELLDIIPITKKRPFQDRIEFQTRRIISKLSTIYIGVRFLTTIEKRYYLSIPKLKDGIIGVLRLVFTRAIKCMRLDHANSVRLLEECCTLICICSFTNLSSQILPKYTSIITQVTLKLINSNLSLEEKQSNRIENTQFLKISALSNLIQQIILVNLICSLLNIYKRPKSVTVRKNSDTDEVITNIATRMMMPRLGMDKFKKRETSVSPTFIPPK